jgi:hypothetical protein
MVFQPRGMSLYMFSVCQIYTKAWPSSIITIGKAVQKIYTAVFMSALAPSPVQLAPGTICSHNANCFTELTVPG